MLFLDYQDRRPIYEQIVEKFRMLILSGAVEPSSKMPSVRQLAVELSINPNTIQKAYAELERQGVLYSLKGRGSFVGSSLQELRKVQQKELLEQLSDLSAELCSLQVPQQEVCAVVQQVYAEAKEGTAHD